MRTSVRMLIHGGVRTLAILVCAFGAWPALGAAEGSESDAIAALRGEIDAIRAEYAQRLAALEARLADLEGKGRPSPAERLGIASNPAAAVSRASVVNGGGRAFNPAIGVIFQGQAWHADRPSDRLALPGFPLGGEAGAPPRGLSLAETELDVSANVDDLFTAWLTAPIVVEDGETKIEVEEAWIETMGLPGGLAARFGRFFSGMGYLNERHSHTWDFIDQPLAYQAFLGNQYLDDGVQLRWLAPLDTYLELGAEVLRGDRFPAAGADDAGAGVRTLFVRSGGDVGTDLSWLASFGWLHGGSVARDLSGATGSVRFDGESDVVVAGLVWKWAPAGNWKLRNAILQTEYLRRREDGKAAADGAAAARLDQNQSGWYAQLIVQPFPHWRGGLRIDALDAGNGLPPFVGSALDPQGDPRRFSVMIDWSHSEFSRLRAQWAVTDRGDATDRAFGLQYIYSIGAHGAHTF